MKATTSVGEIIAPSDRNAKRGARVTAAAPIFHRTVGPGAPATILSHGYAATGDALVVT